MQAFIIYSPAGSDEIYRSDSLVDDNGCGALTFGQGVRLRTWLDECHPSMPVAEKPTDYEHYSEAISTVAKTFGPLGGKAVICRQITGEFHKFDFETMVRRYFAMFPGMFCFAFYHPRYNYWMGASPELLVESTGEHTARTRALAGTRRREPGDTAPYTWDEKNIHEHKVVTADICSRIEAMGPQWQAVPQATEEFDYGNIAHLRTPIEIKCSQGKAIVSDIADAIHPTPAVGGFPRDKAIETIAGLEETPRGYYGGIISTPGQAYVMLRCVHFDSRCWCIYTGSGVTGASSAADEWDETQAKAAPLINLLNDF